MLPFCHLKEMKELSVLGRSPPSSCLQAETALWLSLKDSAVLKCNIDSTDELSAEHDT